MTTIPASSFETNTGLWAKGGTSVRHSIDYQKIDTEVSVDSSDLIIKFTNLPPNVKVANSPAVDLYSVSDRYVKINIYYPELDATFPMNFEYFELSEEWGPEYILGEMDIRDSAGNLMLNEDFQRLIPDLETNLKVVTGGDGSVYLSGTFAFEYGGDQYTPYIFASINSDPRELGNPNTTFENIDGDCEIVSIGARYIPHAYTKINDTTISVPRNVEIKNSYVPTNRLYVNFTR